MIHPTKMALIILLLTSGCTSTPARPDITSQARALFHVDPHHTKVFFYAAYDNAQDRPFFDTTFRLRIDNSDVEDISADQYIEIELTPGSHVFDVDEIVWSGNTANHSSATIVIDTGKPDFIAEVIMPKQRVVLGSVDSERGEKAILARKIKCLCEFELQRIIESL